MQVVVQICALVLSKISRFGTIGAILCRMASLDQIVCKRLALLIAFCLLFSLIPVAGSKLDLKNANESLNLENMVRLPSIPGFIIAPQISARRLESDAMVGHVLKHILELQTLSPEDVQGQSARKLLHTFSKPDQDAIRSVREVECQMKRLNKVQALNSEERYIEAKWFRLIKAIGKGKHPKKDQNVISHGLIRAKPMELTKTDEEKTYPQDHQRKALETYSVELTPVQQPTSSLWRKEESNRLSKLPTSHFALGLTREQEQIHNVVAALRRAGLFGAVAGTIEGMNLFMLPQMSTIFVPTDSAYRALKQEDINIQLFQYHVVMQRYAFTQLCRLTEGDILYTLLPGYSIIVTGEPSPFKITLDGVFLIAPDLYVDESIAVHGIDGVFNCTMYGKKFGDWHVPGVVPPPAANISNEETPPPVQVPGPSSTNGSVAGGAAGENNPSVAGSGEAGQHDPAQQGAGTFLTPTTSGDPKTSDPSTFSPGDSEVASDTDASDVAISAKIGACTAATAFICVMSIFCS